MLDLIVVGLGPAGLALAHRADQRGLQVVGVDPNPEWDHTIGVWADEVPEWLDVPERGRCRPRVRANGVTRELARDYVTVDSQAFRARYTTFPVIRHSATIVDAHSVHTGPTRELLQAQRVVDARGWQHPTGPVQQAAGYLADDGEAWWMDVTGDFFTYSIPVGDRWLVEKTLLISENPLPWPELECEYPAVERVLFPMRVPRYTGPAIPFGVRAGMLNPISGYSVTTAWNSVDDVLDGNYPWQRPRWRIEQALLRRGQQLLLNVDNERFFEEVFRLDDGTLRQLLQLGNLTGTVRGMWALFRQAPWLRRACIRAMFSTSTKRR